MNLYIGLVSVSCRDYAWFLFFVGLAATAVGQHGVNHLVKKYNRFSFISLSIGAVVALSTLLLGAYTHTYLCSYIHILIHTYAHAYIYSYLHILIHRYAHAYMRTYTHTYIYSYIHVLMHTYTHAYIYSYIHVLMIFRIPRRVYTFVSYSKRKAF